MSSADVSLNIGIGRGFAAREYNTMHIDVRHIARANAEALEMLRRALTEEYFSFEGEFFRSRERRSTSPADGGSDAQS